MSVLGRDDEVEEQERIVHTLQNLKRFAQVQVNMLLEKILNL